MYIAWFCCYLLLHLIQLLPLLSVLELEGGGCCEPGANLELNKGQAGVVEGREDRILRRVVQ